MPQRREIEIKLPVRDPRRLKRRLKELGFSISAARALEKNSLFDFADGQLARARQALRIRSFQSKITLTLKGPPGPRRGYKSREEIETEASDQRALRTILRRIGLREEFAYDKYRTTYSANAMARRGESPTIVFDETPVGDFIELEGPPKWIDRIAARLGYRRGDYITESYRSLYVAGRRTARRGVRHRSGKGPDSRSPAFAEDKLRGNDHPSNHVHTVIPAKAGI